MLSDMSFVLVEHLKPLFTKEKFIVNVWIVVFVNWVSRKAKNQQFGTVKSVKWCYPNFTLKKDTLCGFKSLTFHNDNKNT